MTIRAFIAAIAAAAMFATPALAQTEAEFVEAFKGDWQIHDDGYALEGERCRITLSGDGVEGAEGVYGVTVQTCNLELADITGWRIADGQMILLAGENAVASLGGNQRRMSGNSAIGAPIILERTGDNPLVDQLAAARQSSGCYFLGFTNTCVDEAQLAKPTVPSDGSGAKIGVLVNLNARAEARDDAAVIGVVPANSCIVTEVCSTASDGVWCRAQFGEVSGWLKKVALRQERWPVVTFVNQCAE